MALVDYRLDENVALVTLNNGENRLNPDFLTAILDVMDEVEKEEKVNALVVRSAHETFWSFGIDVDWFVPLLGADDQSQIKTFLYRLNELFKRLLLYPMPTIAAITGHAFGGGAMIACAFDFRFMRNDAGVICFPEVDLEIPFLPGMIALCEKAFPKYKFEELAYTGKRATAEECAGAGFVMKACPMDQLMGEAMAFAKANGKKRAIYGIMKERMNGHIVQVINEKDPPHIGISRERLEGKK